VPVTTAGLPVKSLGFIALSGGSRFLPMPILNPGLVIYNAKIEKPRDPTKKIHLKVPNKSA
jgi:hypothetical protein